MVQNRFRAYTGGHTVADTLTVCLFVRRASTCVLYWEYAAAFERPKWDAKRSMAAESDAPADMP